MNSNCRVVEPAAYLTGRTPFTAKEAETQSLQKERLKLSTLYTSRITTQTQVDRTMYSSQLGYTLWIAGSPPARLGSPSFHRRNAMVPQYTKDHLNSILSLPPDWPGNNITQIILGVWTHCQRVSSSPVRADEI